MKNSISITINGATRTEAAGRIGQAIRRSVSHTEIVRVTVGDVAAALAEVSAQCEDYDHTDANDGEDVWGTTEDGSEFRLLLYVGDDGLIYAS